MPRKREKGYRERVWFCSCSGLGFGVFLLILGILWFARDLGWIPNIPLFPVILILFGIWIITSKLFD